jgi:hypothetical protein
MGLVVRLWDPNTMQDALIANSLKFAAITVPVVIIENSKDLYMLAQLSMRVTTITTVVSALTPHYFALY